MKNLLEEVKGVVGSYDAFTKKFAATKYQVEKALIGVNLTEEDRSLRLRVIGEALAEFNRLQERRDVLWVEYHV